MDSSKKLRACLGVSGVPKMLSKESSGRGEEWHVLPVVNAMEIELRRDMTPDFPSSSAFSWTDTAGRTTPLQDVVSYPRSLRRLRIPLELELETVTRPSLPKRKTFVGRQYGMTAGMVTRMTSPQALL